jgi:hypothetical protein
MTGSASSAIGVYGESLRRHQGGAHRTTGNRLLVRFDQDELGVWHDEDGDPVVLLNAKDLMSEAEDILRASNKSVRGHTSTRCDLIGAVLLLWRGRDALPRVKGKVPTCSRPIQPTTISAPITLP